MYNMPSLETGYGELYRGVEIAGTEEDMMTDILYFRQGKGENPTCTQYRTSYKQEISSKSMVICLHMRLTNRGITAVDSTLIVIDCTFYLLVDAAQLECSPGLDFASHDVESLQ